MTKKIKNGFLDGKEKTSSDYTSKKELGDSCQEAYDIITGARNEQYGDQDKNFKLIAQVATLITGKDLSKYDIIKIMIAVKLIRERYRHKEDNIVDLIGYADILNLLEENK